MLPERGISVPTLEQLHTVLMRITFPSSKEEILEQLRRLGEMDEVLERLRSLPEHFYGSVDTVMDTLRGLE